MLSASLDGRGILLHESEWDGQESALRAASREGRVLATCCGAPLVLKWGLRKIRHFAHPAGTHCPFERWTEPESPEHVAGKRLLFDWCRRHFAGRARVLALEYPIEETCQRPDIYLELADGRRLALEYQRSAISPGEWQDRHKGYQSLGIADIWILGENRLAQALPSPDQQERWAAKEPFMLFLDLRAFENAAAVQTPYEVAWWRERTQEELWAAAELDARVGRAVHPWYRRSVVKRLRSLSFLDSGTGELHIYRAMREFPGHIDTRMASVLIRTGMAAPGIDLSEFGFVTEQDRERLDRYARRAAALESSIAANASSAAVQGPAARVAVSTPPLPADWPAHFHLQADRRSRLRWPDGVDPNLFMLAQQEAQQRRRLKEPATASEWGKLVDRFGLRPESLFFLVGVPVPDDTVIRVHRTVWQAYLYYQVIRYPRGSFTAAQMARLLERKFGLDPEMVRVATLLMPGPLNAPATVVGCFLNLLVDTGYLRNEFRSEHFRYHPVDAPPPPLAFVDRTRRRDAWAGLLAGALRLKEQALVGEGLQIDLVPVEVADRPTAAQVQVVAQMAARLRQPVDMDRLTFTEASRLLSRARPKNTQTE